MAHVQYQKFLSFRKFPQLLVRDCDSYIPRLLPGLKAFVTSPTSVNVISNYIISTYTPYLLLMKNEPLNSGPTLVPICHYCVLVYF